MSVVLRVGIACACLWLAEPVLCADSCWTTFPAAPTIQARSNIFELFSASLLVPASRSSCGDACPVTNVTVNGGELISFSMNPSNLPPSGGIQVRHLLLSRGCDTPLEISISSSCAETEHMVFPPMSPGFVARPESRQIIEGDEIRLSVSALCADSFQWRKDGADLIDDAGITGSQQDNLIISGARTNDTGFYTVAVGNSYGTNLTLEVQVTVISALRVTARKVDGETLRLEVRRAGQILLREPDVSNVKIYATDSLDQPFSTWPEVIASATLSNGALLFDLPVPVAPAAQFFRAVEIAP